MSWASIGSRGTATLKTAGADLSFSPTATIPAGQVLIVCIAWAIDYTRTPEGANWPAACVHDSKGNLYTQLGGTSWESHTAIFIGTIESTLTTGDTITVHHRNPGHEPKALTSWAFSRDTTKVWARYHDPNGGGCTNCIGATVGIGGSGAQYEFRGETLIVNAMSSMGPETDSYTYDADYTPMVKAGTTGGSPESNITVTAQFRISSVLNDQATMTRDVNRNTDVTITALYEVHYQEDFPRFPLLDDFNRANEDPLDAASIGGVPTGGTWDPFDPPTFCTNGYAGGELRIDGNQVRKSAITPFGAGGQWWTEPYFGCYAESYVTIPTKGQAGVHLDGGGCGHQANMGGYAAFWNPLYSNYIADDLIESGFTGQTGHVAGNALRTALDIADGYRIGLQRDSRLGWPALPQHNIHCWIDRGSGWEWVNAWNEVVFGPYQGRVGIGVWGDVLTRLDDFGAGAVDDCPGFRVGTNWKSDEPRSRYFVETKP